AELQPDARADPGTGLDGTQGDRELLVHQGERDQFVRQHGDCRRNAALRPERDSARQRSGQDRAAEAAHAAQEAKAAAQEAAAQEAADRVEREAEKHGLTEAASSAWPGRTARRSPARSARPPASRGRWSASGRGWASA